MEACVAEDRQGELTAAVAKAAETFETLCTGGSRTPAGDRRLAPYGGTNAATVASTAVDEERTLAHDVLGANLDAPVASLDGTIELARAAVDPITGRAPARAVVDIPPIPIVLAPVRTTATRAAVTTAARRHVQRHRVG